MERRLEYPLTIGNCLRDESCCPCHDLTQFPPRTDVGRSGLPPAVKDAASLDEGCEHLDMVTILSASNDT